MSKSPTRILKVTPTVAASAHIADDALGGRMDFTGALRESDGGGVLQSIIITHLSTTPFEVDVYLFDDEFIAAADSDPASFTDEDFVGKCIGFVKVRTTDFAPTANQTVGDPGAIGKAIQVKNSPKTLYAQMVTRTAFTPASITVKLGFLKD